MNIVYIVSDNRVTQKPIDPYLKAASTVLELYFAHPLGDYRVIYVNTFPEIVNDLLRRSSQSHEKIDHLIMVTHGQPAAKPGAEKILLPISTGSSLHGAQELADELANLGDVLNQGRKTRSQLQTLRTQNIDERTVLTILGCVIGRNENMLNAFREFFGGKITVFAPKKYQGFKSIKIPGGIGLHNIDKIVDMLIEMKMLNVPETALWRAMAKPTMRSLLMRRLQELWVTPLDGVIPLPLAQIGYLPVMYILPEGLPDEPNFFILPKNQRVGYEWGAVFPKGHPRTTVQLQNMLEGMLPSGSTYTYMPGAEKPKQKPKQGLQLTMSQQPAISIAVPGMVRGLGGTLHRRASSVLNGLGRPANPALDTIPSPRTRMATGTVSFGNTPATSFTDTAARYIPQQGGGYGRTYQLIPPGPNYRTTGQLSGQARTTHQDIISQHNAAQQRLREQQEDAMTAARRVGSVSSGRIDLFRSTPSTSFSPELAAIRRDDTLARISLARGPSGSQIRPELTQRMPWQINQPIVSPAVGGNVEHAVPAGEWFRGRYYTTITGTRRAPW